MIGIDIVKNNRIKKIIKKNNGLEKILTNKEQVIFYNIKNKQERLNYASGRFSAKESIIKATNKKMLFSKIEILNSSSGKPEVYYENQKNENIEISISHENKYSIAVAFFKT